MGVVGDFLGFTDRQVGRGEPFSSQDAPEVEACGRGFTFSHSLDPLRTLGQLNLVCPGFFVSAIELAIPVGIIASNDRIGHTFS